VATSRLDEPLLLEVGDSPTIKRHVHAHTKKKMMLVNQPDTAETASKHVPSQQVGPCVAPKQFPKHATASYVHSFPRPYRFHKHHRRSISSKEHLIIG
jgi:hypothetical protein